MFSILSYFILSQSTLVWRKAVIPSLLIHLFVLTTLVTIMCIQLALRIASFEHSFLNIISVATIGLLVGINLIYELQIGLCLVEKINQYRLFSTISSVSLGCFIIIVELGLLITIFSHEKGVHFYLLLFLLTLI